MWPQSVPNRPSSLPHNLRTPQSTAHTAQAPQAMTTSLNPPQPSRIFQFSEQRPEFVVPVLNERAVRASAGLLFFFAIVAFMNAWLVGNFGPTRVFVVAFLVEFTIRIFVNPRFAPSLIVGQWVVRHQQAEYVGAPQKRFAWAIGFGLALAMLYLMVIHQVVGPINLLVCGACLLLLFFEAAFGICLGCKVYNTFNKEKAQLCPGAVCERPADTGPGTSPTQAAIVLAFVALIALAAPGLYHPGPPPTAPGPNTSLVAPHAAPAPGELERCKVPDFAKAMGHEEKWKLHNNCK